MSLAMTTPDRIRAAYERKGWTATLLAEKLGIKQGTFSKIMSGLRPGRKHLQKISELTGVSVEWLTVGDNPPPWDSQSPSAPMRARESPTTYTTGHGLRVVGIAAAGDHDQAGAWQQMREPEPLPLPDSWEAVQVRGDSAYPVAFDGQFVLIDTARVATGRDLSPMQARDLHDNLVLVVTEEDGEEHAYIKRFCCDARAPAGFIFASVNAGRASPYLPPEMIATIVPVVGVLFEDPRLPRKKGRVTPMPFTAPGGIQS